MNLTFLYFLFTGVRHETTVGSSEAAEVRIYTEGSASQATNYGNRNSGK